MPAEGQERVTVIVRRDEANPTKWVVIEEDANGLTTIGGPFDTRSYARQVAEGASIMAQRLAAKRESRPAPVDGQVDERRWTLRICKRCGRDWKVPPNAGGCACQHLLPTDSENVGVVPGSERDRLAVRVTYLESVIRRAPHAHHCEAGASFFPGACSCWKLDAMVGLSPASDERQPDA